MSYINSIKKFSLLLIFAKELNYSVNIPPMKFYMNRFGITNFLDIKIRTFSLKTGRKVNILYVKDLFDVNGNFKSLDDFSDSILMKNNWLCEYFILKNVFSKLKQYLTYQMQYIQILKTI